MYRLCLKYRLIAIILISGVLCAAVTPLLWNIESNVWVYAIFYTFFIVLAFCFVESSSDKLLKNAAKALNNDCDPTILLGETEEQLKYVKSGVTNQLIVLNHAVALSYMGEYEKVLDILKSFDVDKYKFISPYNGFVKMIYCNNMSDALDELGDSENASLWHEKTMLAAKKNGAANSKEIILARASEHLRKKEYEKALETLESFKSKSKLDSVCAAMVYAKAYTALGDSEKAKEKLNFIIENGNKLYMTEQAGNMLAKIEKAQSNDN